MKQAMKLYQILVLILGLQIIADDIVNAIFIPLYRPLQFLLGFPQPYNQILAGVVLDIVNVLFFILIYGLFELIQRNLGSKELIIPTNNEAAIYPDRDDVVDQAEKEGTTLLASILYKPVIIGAFVLQFTDRFRIFKPVEEGGELILGNYLLIALIYTVTLVLISLMVRLEGRSDSTDIDGGGLKRAYTYLYRLLLLSIILNYYLSQFFFRIVIPIESNTTVFRLFRSPLFYLVIALALSILGLRYRDKIKRVLGAGVFTDSKLFVRLKLYQLLMIVLIIPPIILNSLLFTIYVFPDLSILIIVFVILLGIFLTLALITGQKLLTKSSGEQLSKPRITISVALTFIYILIIIDFFLFSDGILYF